jgi:hypothetical protein
MRCFSGPIKHVAETSIFCRMGARGNQVVIYSMVLEAEQDLAMVLPVPVAEQRDEDSVSFIDLSLSPDFWVAWAGRNPSPSPPATSMPPA